MNINLHIERLVLDGVNVPPGQRHLLQSIVASELTQLLTSGGLSPSLAQGVALPHINADNIHRTDNNPKHLGRQIAQSVYGGIGHE